MIQIKHTSRLSQTQNPIQWNLGILKYQGNKKKKKFNKSKLQITEDIKNINK